MSLRLFTEAPDGAQADVAILARALHGTHRRQDCADVWLQPIWKKVQ
jgi:hypothetical protein